MLLTGAVEGNDLAQGALQRFTQCRSIGWATFQLRGGHSTTELTPPQRNLRRQCLSVRFERRGNVNREQPVTGALTFASLPSNVISFVCSKELSTGRKWLCLPRKVWGMLHNCPQVSVLKRPDFTTNTGAL